MTIVTRFQLRSASHLFLIQGGKILLARRKGAWKAGFYSVPAGHLEREETARQTILREAKEEIGVEVAPQDLHFLHVMHRTAKDADYIDFFFTADKWQGEIKNLEPDKCDDLSWFSLDELPENTVTYVREAIENYQKDNPYSESGWNGDAE